MNMKNEKIIYGLSSILVIGGAIMKILHWPHAAAIFIFGFIVRSLFQTWQISQLKKRIQDLENK